MNRKAKLVLMVLAVFSMVFALTGLTACGKGGVSAPTNIKYDGSAITWDSVEDATGYVIKVGEGAEINCATNSFTYKANQKEFSVTLKAVKDGKKKKESDAVTMSFKPLPTVENLKVSSEGVITWDEVETDASIVYEVKDGSSVLPTTYAECEIESLDVGEHKIRVRAIVPGDNSYYSTWSSSVTVNYLATVDVETITYDGTYISYGSVNGAASYNIKIDGVLVGQNITQKKYAYDAHNENFTVSVQPIGDHVQSFDGEESETRQFKFLPIVTGVKVQDGVLSWNDVANADGYELKINGQLVAGAITESQYSGNALVPGQNLDIEVRAIAQDAVFFSYFSPVESVLILKAPQLDWNRDLSLDGGENSLIWNAIDGASGYKVNVLFKGATDSDFRPLSSEIFGASHQNYANQYAEVGEYKITVQATANENVDNVSSSVESTAVTVVRPAPAEKKSEAEFIISNATDLSNGFTVNLKDSSIAYTYKLYKDGKEEDVSERPSFKVEYADIADEDAITGTEYTFAVKKMGSVRQAGNQLLVTLNSKTENNLEFKITILATPQNVRMDGFNICYNEVVGASNGYAITGVGSNPLTEGTLTRDLSASLQAGEYNMQVCAKGNGKDVLPSNYSAGIKVIRLSAPSNLSINTNNDNGRLVFDEQENATGYQMYLNDHAEGAPTTTFTNMNSIISTEGTSVKLQAIANRYVESTYYMTSTQSASKQFIKLKAPTNLRFTNTTLSWDLEGITDAASGLVTYSVFDEKNGVKLTPDANTKSMDVSHLAGGKSYTFSVQAFGDGATYVNSEISTAAQVYKLETPEVTKENGKYVWYGVTSAVSYSVVIDGVVGDTQMHLGAGKKHEFDPKAYFNQIKTYNVSITAVGNGGSSNSGTGVISSKPNEFTQATVQLSTPEFSVAYDKAQYDPTGKILVNVTTESISSDNSKCAKGYKYIVQGNTAEVLTGTTTTYSFNPNGAGRFSVQVGAIGGTFDTKGVYTLDSRSAAIKYITLLSTTNYDNCDITDGQLSFAAVQHKVKYLIEIYVNDSAVVSESYETTEVTFNLFRELREQGYTNVKKLVIKITAKGNGTDIIDGQSLTRTWESEESYI